MHVLLNDVIMLLLLYVRLVLKFYCFSLTLLLLFWLCRKWVRVPRRR